MAICSACGEAEASFPMSMCAACLATNRSPSLVGQPPRASHDISGPLGASDEGTIASLIGNTIIWLSLIGSIICVIAFGRIEVPDGRYETTLQWNTLLVSI